MRADAWVILIEGAPGEPDSQEMLEFVLAGASLELELVVVFAGAGLGHLTGAAVKSWRQLVDFKLSTVWYQAPAHGDFSPDLPARPASTEEIHQWCGKARGVIEL